MDKPQTGRNELTRRAALLAVARIIGFAATLPLPLVLVRALSRSDFGLYKQSFQILTTALALLGLHVSSSAYYYMPRNPDKKPQIVLNILIFYGAVGGVAALIFALYPGLITSIFKTDDLLPFIPLIGLSIFLWLLSSVLEIVALAEGDIRSATLFIVLIQIAKSGLLLGAAVVFNSVHAVVISGVVQGALHSLLMFLYLRKPYGRFWRSFDPALFKAQLANALPFGLGALAYATQADMHNYFVSHYFEPAMFAIYSIGWFQLPLLGLLLDSVISVLLPEVAKLQVRGDYDGIIALWASAIRKLAFFCVPTYTFLFVMRYEFITLLFTNEYADSVPIFALNLLGIPLYISVYTSIMRAFDDMKFFRLKLSLLMIPVTAVALYVGIKSAGLVGAAAAVMLLQIVDVAIIVSSIGRRLRVSLGDLKRLTPVVRIAVTSTVAGLVTFALRLSLPVAHPSVSLAVCGALFGTVFIAAAFGTGIISDEEKAELRRFYQSGSKRLGFSPATES